MVFAKLAWPLFVPIEGGFYDLFALSPTFFWDHTIVIKRTFCDGARNPLYIPLVG